MNRRYFIFTLLLLIFTSFHTVKLFGETGVSITTNTNFNQASIAQGTAPQNDSKVTLSGRVIDNEQNPVIFASVKVEGQMAGATTDLDGKYSFTFTSADTIVITYSLIGYQKRTKKLIHPQGKLTLNIVMQPLSLNLGEITIKESRRQLNTTEHINVENLKRLPSTSGNAVEELIATQAGVSTHNELSSQYLSLIHI